MIELLVAQPALNINLCTSHGLALNTAIKMHNAEIVEKLLVREVNFSVRDHVGRTVKDVLNFNPDS
jgi:hypothetical protein